MTDRLHFVGSGSGSGGSLSRNYESVVGTLTQAAPTLITSTDTSNLYVGMLITGSTNHGFANGTHIESIDSSVQLTLSTAATPLVSSISTSIRYQYVNYDIPTNPRISLVDSLSSTDRLYTGIFSDDSNATLGFNEVGTTSANTEWDNLSNTEGYKIHCFQQVGLIYITGTASQSGTTVTGSGTTFTSDMVNGQITYANGVQYTITAFTDSTHITVNTSATVSGQAYKITNGNSIGVQLVDATANYSDSDFTLYNYYVLLHSDNHLLHHFARITEVLSDDVNGDAFEFEPRLGSEIPKGTKFMIFKGSLKTTYPLAVSAGIKMNLQHDLICARPLFYFFNDSLDKNNELNHNRKYYAYCQVANSSGAVDLDATDTKATLLTVTDYSTDIIDYSKYSLKVKLTDKLRILDAPKTNTSNEGNTPNTLDFEDYDDAFPNARRDDDDLHTSLQYRGPLRYLHYTYSPDKSNLVANAIDNVVYESYGQRGGYAETKISDMFRIMNKKIEEHKPYRIRHAVHRADFNDWFDLDVKVLSASSPTYTFTTTYNLTNFLNAGDEVRVGSSTIFIIDSIGSFTAATGTTPASQPITFEISGGNKYHKTDGEAGVFGASTNPTISVDDILYRRAFNGTDKTLLTDFDLVADRYENLYINFIIDDYSFLRATVTAIDVEKKLLTLSFTSKTYGTAASSGLEWATGEYVIEIQRFDGLIEQINSYQEDGQRLMKISGRNNFSKLISPIINKNTAFSEDMIYSTNSPYNKSKTIGGALYTSAFGSLTLSYVSGTVTVTPVAGHKLFFRYDNEVLGYIGEVSSYNSGTKHITLKDKPRTYGASQELYYAESKYYVFNKALASNHLTSSVTSLAGAADKGIFFTGGMKLSTTTLGAEDSELIGSTDSTQTHPNALGYNITEGVSMDSDNQFQARLSDNASSKTFETFDTVNSLLDFSVINISTANDGTSIEIAPYLPLTLARMDINYANVLDTTFTSLGTLSAGSTNSRILTTTDATSALSTVANPRNHHGKPVYIGGVFAGLFVAAQYQSNNTTICIFLDRPVTFLSGASIQILTYTTDKGSSKKTHELSIVNGGHLHGGKIIGLLSPTTKGNVVTDSTVDNIYLMDYLLVYNSMGSVGQKTTIHKYGSPYYRIFNLEKGNINQTSSYTVTDIGDIEYYGKEPSVIPYYATSYKFDPAFWFRSSTEHDGIIGVSRTEDDAAHSVLESRGFTNVYGSRFFDAKLYPIGGKDKIMIIGRDSSTSEAINDKNAEGSPYPTIDVMNQIDPKVARMFLFGNCDLLPYSSARYDSLMYGGQTRDITNYSLLLLDEPKTTAASQIKTAKGSTKTITNVDASYSSAVITSADKTLSELKRFNVMRLTEMCFDWAFNQFDPENIPKGDLTLPKFRYNHYDLINSTIRVTAGSSYGTSSKITGLTNSQVTAAVAAGLAANSYITDIKGRYIGRVQTVTVGSGSDGELVFYSSNGPYKTDGTAFYGDGTASYPLYFVTDAHETDYATITGHGGEDTFVKIDGAIHMLRSAVINDDGTSGYGESTSSAFEEYYSTSLAGGDTYNSETHAVQSAGLSAYDSTTTIKGYLDGREANIFLPISLDWTSRLGIERKGFSTKIGSGGQSSGNNTIPVISALRAEVSTLLAAGKTLYIEVDGDASVYASGTTITAAIGVALTTSTNLTDSVSADDRINIWWADGDDAYTEHPSKVLKVLSGLHGRKQTLTASGNDFVLTPCLPVFLDRFGIEDGAGNVSAGMVGHYIRNGSIQNVNDSSVGASYVAMSLYHDFSHLDGLTGETSNAADDADGVMLGFKPRLYMASGEKSATNVMAGNKNSYTFTFDPATEVTANAYNNSNSTDAIKFNRLFLDLINDLTGCYLVSEAGKYYDINTETTISTEYLNQISINDCTPTTIAYVISHEIDTTTATTKHIITVDKDLGTGFYRIMQPNHTCFYDFTPKEIRLNTLSSSYTKMANENSTYSKINSFVTKNKKAGRTVPVKGSTTNKYNNQGGSEAFLSMYVIADIDSQSDSDYLVIRDINTNFPSILTAGEYEVAVADGENVFKTSLTYRDNGDSIGHYLSFSKLKTSIGVPSISETITLDINGDVSSKAKRALIGSGVTICNEAETLVNNLLEENDINFTIEDNDYPLFLAPNYKGVDLFSAINLILSKKDKSIIVEDEVFKIRSKNNPKHYSKIVLSDNGEHQIFAYEEVKQLYDFYNEIIVYGNTHKATRKDLRSVQKIGRKTLEVYESDLTTQDEVSQRASELLRMHTDDNIKLKITVGHTKISQLRAGDIIGVELKAENIPLNEYIVLQIEHTLTGMMELELGRYSKQLEDRFAELLAENKKINADIRAKKFDESVVSYDFLDSFKIKEVRLLVRKVSSSGGATLGFTTTLNTSTTPMGFSGGSTDTITDLVEEEF